MKLQDIFDRCEKLDTDCHLEAIDAMFKAYDPEAFDGALLKAKKARHSQFLAIQSECRQLTGHAYSEQGYCVICSHDKNAHAEAIRVNLLKG